LSNPIYKNSSNVSENPWARSVISPVASMEITLPVHISIALYSALTSLLTEKNSLRTREETLSILQSLLIESGEMVDAELVNSNTKFGLIMNGML